MSPDFCQNGTVDRIHARVVCHAWPFGERAASWDVRALSIADTRARHMHTTELWRSSLLGVSGSMRIVLVRAAVAVCNGPSATPRCSAT